MSGMGTIYWIHKARLAKQPRQEYSHKYEIHQADSGLLVLPLGFGIFPFEFPYAPLQFLDPKLALGQHLTFDIELLARYQVHPLKCFFCNRPQIFLDPAWAFLRVLWKHLIKFACQLIQNLGDRVHG